MKLTKIKNQYVVSPVKLSLADEIIVYIGMNESIAISVEKESVGQYTGLQDKNEIAIYEGDIVRIDDDYNMFGMMAGEKREVYFNYGGYRLKPLQHLNIQFGHWLEDGDNLEVVGNIYENPELLEKEALTEDDS